MTQPGTPSAGPTPTRVDRRVRLGLVALVVLVGATSAAIAWQQEADAVRRDEIASVEQARELLEGVDRQIEASLAGSAGLVSADGSIGITAFERFAGELAESTDVTALAFERVVPAAEREAFEEELGRPIIDIDDGVATPAPSRPVHYPVRVVAPPSDTTEALLGFDLQGDPVRSAAAARALETGGVALSEPLPSVPTGTQSFFVIKALFRPTDDPTEPPNPTDHLGFVSTAFPGSRLAEVLAADLPSGDRFVVRDGESILARSDSPPSEGDLVHVEVGDRTWDVLVDSGAAPDHTVSWLLGAVTLLLAGGLVGAFRRSDDHHRLLDDAARRASLLAGLAQRLNAAPTVDAVAEVVTTIGREPVHAAASSIGVLEGTSLEVHHGDTVPEEYRATRRSIALDADLGFAVAARGAALLFEDQAAYEARFPDAGGPLAGARAFHPIRRANGTTIGAMAHLWDQPRTFDEVDVATLSTIADLTGQAIERARLAEETAQHARRSEQLAQLARGLASRSGSEDVMIFLTRAVLAPLDADHAAVAVIEGDRLRRYFTPGPITELLDEVLPETVPLDDDSPLAAAARTGETLLLVGEEEFRERYPHLAEGWIALGFRATANLPLHDRRGELIGALGVAWNEPVRPTDLLPRLATVAGIAGQTLDRAQLADAEHRLTLTLQASVLTTMPEVEGLRCTARYVPASSSVGMGGDWYEGIRRANDRYLVIVGDIAGHGVPAVAQMAHLRASIGTIARLGTPVEDILPLASTPYRVDNVDIATAAIVEIDAARNRLCYCCAGHPPPLVRDPSGEVTTLDGGRQPLLGMAMEPVPPGEAAFEVGAVLVCYTDGLIERRDEPIDESIRCLADFLAGIESDDAEEIADALIERWRGVEGQLDDVALAVVTRVR